MREASKQNALQVHKKGEHRAMLKVIVSNKIDHFLSQL